MSFVGTADIETRVYPTIDLNLAGLPLLSVRTIIESCHQRRLIGVGLSDHRGTAIRPHCERKRRIRFRRRISTILGIGTANALVVPVVPVSLRESLPESTARHIGDGTGGRRDQQKIRDSQLTRRNYQ